MTFCLSQTAPKFQLAHVIVYTLTLLGVKIDTRNILFVGAGAFQHASPGDLALELQGRLPVHVKMEKLGIEDYVKIMTDTKNGIINQTVELMRVEGLDIAFS